MASGTYNEKIVMGNGISLIGSGMDSCFLDTRYISPQSNWYVIWIDGDANVSGFCIMASKYSFNGCTGMAIFGPNKHSKIENNKIQNAAWGIAVSSNSSLIKSNIIISSDRGIEVSHYDPECYPVIENNYIASEGTGVNIFLGTRTIIRHNFFYFHTNTNTTAVNAADYDSVYMYNNIAVATIGYNGFGHGIMPAVVHNNLTFGEFYNWSFAMHWGADNEKNNLSINTEAGIGTTVGGGGNIKYNNSWGGKRNYINFIPDSTNLSVDPMIVSDDSLNLDFHLQKYSPMIDAGDPDIKDVDGSRSDIGVYGGPFGESYTYKDLAPREPRNITGILQKGRITLNWQKNTEADFAYYRIYRDTVSTVIKDTSKRYARLTDTMFIDSPVPGKNYYYRLSATDNQGNESILSQETGIITGINEKPGINLQDYILYQNYPNPFNPSTKIGYRLLKPGYVRIAVYDIKGALIKDLENSYRHTGYYEIEFTGQKGEGIKDAVERFASGVYLCRIEIKNENNIPVFMDMKKMIMLK